MKAPTLLASERDLRKPGDRPQGDPGLLVARHLGLGSALPAVHRQRRPSGSLARPNVPLQGGLVRHRLSTGASSPDYA